MFTWWSLCAFISLLLLPFFSGLVYARVYNSTAGLSTKWMASAPAVDILRSGHNGSGTTFTCGFYFPSDQNICYFGIFIARAKMIGFTESVLDSAVVWSANRNNPISPNSTLELTAEGNLVLTDVNGSVAWSTHTVGMSIAGMNLTEVGNLVLFDKNNATVWQSFDQPTDSLVLGQQLKVGQKWTPSTSQTNWTEQGLLSVSMTTIGLFAQTETDPSQVYYSVGPDFPESADFNHTEFINGGLAFFLNYTKTWKDLLYFDPSVQFVKFESDGHLRSYRWDGNDWVGRDDLIMPHNGGCGYPTVCGQYGICSADEQCSCPEPSEGTRYFYPIDYSDPKFGCVEAVPLSCEASQFQTFLELNGVSYFTHKQNAPDLRHTDKESCKEACANSCSCSAAFFYNDSSCYFVSQVFSLTYSSPSYSIAFIKVQNVSKKPNALKVILYSSVGSLFAIITFSVVIKFLVLRRQKVDEVVEEDYIGQLPGLTTRFTYDDLLSITEGFSKKIGEGGFGSVFEGTLSDGTKVAVKRLDALRQIRKSFLAEVETIGNIHHVNLVRLIGICAEKFHRLLIYEYMSKGSLDNWIFHKSKESFVLEWEKRRKIIYDIAKGLNYLHEECRWKIVHMDIKPQNILLDEHFNAKVADFGLSKLLDRDQSRAVTTMRGTLGYLAPEWLSATITEKVDVYSFGVVVLEIVCGRKVFDSSRNEEDMYLLGVFQGKVEEGRILDMADHTCEDMQLNRPHVINMMRIAAWCLQGDFSKRPSMSLVIKALDGVVEIPDALDYDFSHRPLRNINVTVGQEYNDFGATTVLPSILSGPR